LILVDTNVLLDVATDSPWYDWSIAEINKAVVAGGVVINPVIYAELSARYADQRVLDDFLEQLEARFFEIPKAALFLAGKAFSRYRKLGGAKSNVLPDFFIGAHAVIAVLPLLTRDRRRYATYFPTVELISPDQA
jgi:predicted nucleic acid-binding protein